MTELVGKDISLGLLLSIKEYEDPVRAWLSHYGDEYFAHLRERLRNVEGWVDCMFTIRSLIYMLRLGVSRDGTREKMGSVMCYPGDGVKIVRELTYIMDHGVKGLSSNQAEATLTNAMAVVIHIGLPCVLRDRIFNEMRISRWRPIDSLYKYWQLRVHGQDHEAGLRRIKMEIGHLNQADPQGKAYGITSPRSLPAG
jgi:hypothetical protein